MQAAILIGGAGTRLGDQVRHRPKPLLEVAGRPFLDHLLANLARFGIDDVLLLAGYRSAVVQEEYGDLTTVRSRLGTRATPRALEIVVEPTPLGTAGALRHAAAHLKPAFFLLNGDSFFDINYLELCLAEEGGGAVMALRPVADAARYGLVETQGDVVTAFREKSASSQGGLINGGVYWLHREILTRIDATPCSLENDVIPALVAERRIRAKHFDGFFIDIGVPDDLERADQTLAATLRRPAAFLILSTKETERLAHGDDELVHLVKRWNDRRALVFVVTRDGGAAVSRERLNSRLRTRAAHLDEIAALPGDGETPSAVQAAATINGWLDVWPIHHADSIIVAPTLPQPAEIAHLPVHRQTPV